MKFKVLVIFLNIVLITFFISIFVLPFFLDSIDIKTFFSQYWFFAPIFLAIILAINILYARNKNVIGNVESGDWTALAHSLEHEVFDKKHASFQNVKLLAEVQLLLSDFAGLQRLELFVRNNKSEYLPRLASKFAGAKLLSGQYNELYTFTSNLVKSGKKDDPWIVFYVPFSLQMLKEHKAASEGFGALLDTFSEPLLSAMVAYFYYEVLKRYCSLTHEENAAKVQAVRDNIKSRYSLQTWKAYTVKQMQEIHVLVFKKVIADCTTWLFA